MNVSAKFYPDDKVGFRKEYGMAITGEVLDTDDEDQTVLVKWENGRKEWTAGSLLRVLPPHEVAIS